MSLTGRYRGRAMPTKLVVTIPDQVVEAPFSEVCDALAQQKGMSPVRYLHEDPVHGVRPGTRELVREYNDNTHVRYRLAPDLTTGARLHVEIEVSTADPKRFGRPESLEAFAKGIERRFHEAARSLVAPQPEGAELG